MKQHRLSVVILYSTGENRYLLRILKIEYVTCNSKKKKDAVVDISTNGVLLNKEMVDFLYEQKVSITISFDGKD